MIIFLHGADNYRLQKKLDEIIEGNKKVHKSGLNLIRVDAKESEFKDVLNSLKTISMFTEKKLVIIKNVFENKKFEEEFLKELKNLESLKDVIVIYSQDVDKRGKLFKALEKQVKCQEFESLGGAKLKNWLLKELENKRIKMDFLAQDLLLLFCGNDLWQIENELKKLSDYKRILGDIGSPPNITPNIIKREDVELLVRPKIEMDIFKTIDALAQQDKRQALDFLHKHIESGDNCLYLLSMIAFQFRNLLIIKELLEKRMPYQMIAKKSGLHPFVVKKTYAQSNQFSFLQLKKIYQRIFQIDLDIKTGKIDAELALDLLISEI